MFRISSYLFEGFYISYEDRIYDIQIADLLNLSKEEYQQILKDCGATKEEGCDCVIKNEENAIEIINFLESYLMLNKLTGE